VRFAFLTLGYIEAEFYARVGDELARQGDEAMHVTLSRRAAQRLRRGGRQVVCLPDVMRGLRIPDPEAAIRDLVARWSLPSFRDLYRSDPGLRDRPEAFCVDHALRQALAIEQILDEHPADVLVPEVGREVPRLAMHHAGLERGTPVLFLFYTIFPNPLRLYVNTMDAPIAEPDSVRPLTDDEQAELDAFRERFVARDQPIRAYRHRPVSRRLTAALVRHLLVKATVDRDNVYLRPGRWLGEAVAERVRARAVRPLYEPIPDRPFIYFPLHVADDYKLEYLIPHLADQYAVAAQVSRALPHGVDLVLKEHPMSIGRNDPGELRRVKRLGNVRIVPPHTSRHALIERAQAVAVISSTVGLEALLHRKPVLTLGRPFYAGLGATRDVDSVSELRVAVPALIEDRPDAERIDQVLGAAMRACRPGAPVLVNRSPANARLLAKTLHDAAYELAHAPYPGAR
jgi:hypothetical protein